MRWRGCRASRIDTDMGSLGAQLGKRLTIDLGSVHDLRVVRWSLMLGSALGMEPESKKENKKEGKKE